MSRSPGPCPLQTPRVDLPGGNPSAADLRGFESFTSWMWPRDHLPELHGSQRDFSTTTTWPAKSTNGNPWLVGVHIYIYISPMGFFCEICKLKKTPQTNMNFFKMFQKWPTKTFSLQSSWSTAPGKNRLIEITVSMGNTWILSWYIFQVTYVYGRWLESTCTIVPF